MKMVSAQPTSSLPLDEADEREIQLIMNEGYTHAVATEIYLNRLAVSPNYNPTMTIL